MKRRIGILLALLVALLIFTASPVYAVIALPDSTPTVESKKFYRNLIEDGDRLLVIYANIPYGATPAVPVTESFIWELKSGTTVLGSTVGYAYVDSGYGYNVYSMYFSAAYALTWNPGTPYTLTLRGNPVQFTVPPEYNYTINAADYSSITTSADVQDELALDVINISSELDSEWGLTESLLYEDETGTTLSTLGQAFWRGAVYSIQSLAPALFPLAIQEIDLEDRTWSGNYTAELSNQYSGTWADTAKAAGAAFFGTSVDLLSLIILLVLVIGVIVGNIYLTNDHWNGLIDAAFILVITAKVGLYGLGYLGLIVAICIIYLAMRLFGMARG